MGDHRLSVEITLIGSDGETKKISWHVNWWEDKPAKLFDAMVKMAEEAHLPVNPYYEDSREE